MALVMAALVVTACGSDPAFVGHGRQDSWQRVARSSFDAGTSHGIAGLAPPGEGYGRWTAVGSVREGGSGRTWAAAWSSHDGTRWARSALGADDVRESIASAAAVRQGVAVVVGTVITAVGDRDVRVWTSGDGATWNVVPLGGGGGDQRMTSVAAGPLGFVAAGADGSVPAVWTSPDGASWTRVEPSVFVEGQRIGGVAVGRAGAVAVGTTETSGDVDGMAWFSADGLTWRTAPSGGPAAFGGRAAQRLNAVTATSGRFVAVGDDADAERRVAAVWTSIDGLLWQREAEIAQSGVSTAGLAAGAVAGAGPIAAVGDNGFSLQVWTSPDGTRWTTKEAPAPAADGPLEHTATVATNGAAVLVGMTGGGLWRRAAGARWVDVGGDGIVFPTAARTYRLRDMTGGRTGVLAVETNGFDTVWRSTNGMAWEERREPFGDGSVAALTRFGDMAVAVGTIRDPGSVAAVWISTDGGDTWERTGAGNPAFATRSVTQMFAVTAGGPGLVAVGLGFDGRTIDAHAWYSPDGRSWRRAAEPPAWSAPGDEVLGVACPLPGGGVVALGTTEVLGDQDVWAGVSGDGITWHQATGPEASLLGGPGLQGAGGCASTPTGVVVAGRTPGRGGSDGVLWSTADGKVWTTVGGPDMFGGPGEDFLRAVAADGNRLVATGVEAGRLTVHTSADGGATWRKRTASAFPGFDEQIAASVAIVDDRVVMTGFDGPSGAVWVGPAR